MHDDGMDDGHWILGVGFQVIVPQLLPCEQYRGVENGARKTKTCCSHGLAKAFHDHADWKMERGGMILVVDRASVSEEHMHSPRTTPNFDSVQYHKVVLKSTQSYNNCKTNRLLSFPLKLSHKPFSGL
jgi:hypothetical protein